MRSVVLVGGSVLAAAGTVALLPTGTVSADVPSASPQALATVTPAARQASACKQLRGKDLAPAPRVKLVRRRNKTGGTDLVGCVRPRGRVRVLASSSDQGTTVESYKVRQVAGAIVLLASSYDSQYATDARVSVSSIRTGRKYVIARSCARLGGGDCGGPPATAPVAFVNRRGQAAAAIVSPGENTVTIAGFSSRGERRDLDSGPAEELPPASLQLKRSVVSWMHSGETRSATLSG